MLSFEAIQDSSSDSTHNCIVDHVPTTACPVVFYSLDNSDVLINDVTTQCRVFKSITDIKLLIGRLIILDQVIDFPC